MFSFLAKFDSFNQGKNDGFTITEVIVSALIIAILAAGISGALSGAQYMLNRVRHKMQAYNYATEALDRLRSNYKYEDAAMSVTPPIHTDADIGGGIIQGEMAGLSTTVSYDVTESQPNGYKEVTIRVHWTEHTL
jgi:prepilin-type N-terminal cleavage/methylation domain-containing protein